MRAVLLLVVLMLSDAVYLFTQMHKSRLFLFSFSLFSSVKQPLFQMNLSQLFFASAPPPPVSEENIFD